MTSKKPERIAIFGANADIAKAMARLWAARGARLCLFSRDKKRLSRLAQDLTLRGASFVSSEAFEARNFASHEQLLSHAHKALGGLQVVVLAQGILPNQNICEKNFEQARVAWETNFLSVASLAHLACARMEKKGGGDRRLRLGCGRSRSRVELCLRVGQRRGRAFFTGVASSFGARKLASVYSDDQAWVRGYEDDRLVSKKCFVGKP